MSEIILAGKGRKKFRKNLMKHLTESITETYYFHFDICLEILTVNAVTAR